MDEIKAAFMKIETPEDFMAFKKQYPNAKADREMAEHLQLVANKYSNGETRENHTDPRAAFLKK